VGWSAQIAWYERRAVAGAHRLGWQPARLAAWLLALWSDDVDQAIVANRDAFARFPDRAAHMLEVVRGATVAGRGLALLDPSSHRSDWLIRTRLDGRRSRAPVDGYASAARALGRKNPGPVPLRGRPAMAAPG
jgi:hypothetical protein